MNIFYLLAVCLLSFVLFEIWQFYSNYNNITNFNSTYYNLQYGTGTFTTIDPNTTDPNDFVNNVQQKFRCVLDPTDNLYYAFSIYGYYSNSALTRSLNFNTQNACLNYTFLNTNLKIIYNACYVYRSGYDCEFILKNI
jgi:hypothetical protein